MVHRRQVGDEVLVFGNQGALWGNAMTWWDHGTGTVWSQPLGEAIVGERRGEKLELMASQLTSWATWRTQHPGTLALDAPAGRSGFHVATMSVIIDFGEEVGVYPVSDLYDVGPANDTVAGVPVAVVVGPDSIDQWSVLHRVVGDEVLELKISNGQLVDRQTGTVWDAASGRGVEGPLAGEVLEILPGFTSFESDARTFWPDAKYWRR